MKLRLPLALLAGGVLSPVPGGLLADPPTSIWSTNDLCGWSLLAEGGAQGSVVWDSTAPLSDRNPHSLRLTIKNTGGRCGIVNDGFAGLSITAGEWYSLTFYARTEASNHFGLTFSFESKDGRKVCARATIPEVGGAWERYTLALRARETTSKPRMVITISEPGTIWMNVLSFSPRQNSNPRPVEHPKAQVRRTMESASDAVRHGELEWADLTRRAGRRPWKS